LQTRGPSSPFLFTDVAVLFVVPVLFVVRFVVSFAVRFVVSRD